MSSFADLLYPAECVGCSRPAVGGFCRACFEDAPRLTKPNCPNCGAPVSSSCRECRGRSFEFDEAHQALAFQGPVRSAIHRLKYRGDRDLAQTLVHSLAPFSLILRNAPLAWVPTSNERLSERGFDHGRLLVQAAADVFGAILADILTRTRSTPPQVTLTPRDRMAAQRHSMRARLPSPAFVVVLDDVFTTGASISEAARALKASGARKVFALSIARTLSLPAESSYNPLGP